MMWARVEWCEITGRRIGDIRRRSILVGHSYRDFNILDGTPAQSPVEVRVARAASRGVYSRGIAITKPANAEGEGHARHRLVTAGVG
jgi:hypothetical protein